MGEDKTITEEVVVIGYDVMSNEEVDKLKFEMNVYDSMSKEEKNNALISCSYGGYISDVKYLIENGADVNFKDSEGSTALFGASSNGFKEIVKILIDAGAKFKEDKIETSELFMASGAGYTDVVEILLNAGADVNYIGGGERSALSQALTFSRTETAKLLINAGADIGIVSYDNGMSALMWASRKGLIELVEILIEMGVDVNAVDKNGMTAILHADKYGHYDVWEILIDAGADVDLKDVVN